MLLVLSSFLFDFIAIILALGIAFISYIKWREQYWMKRKIPFLKFKMGFSLTSSNKNSVAERFKDLYDQMKEKKWKFCGSNIMLEPILMVNDLNLLRNILTKDFQHFTNRGLYLNEKDDPLSGHLFFLNDTKWHNLRVKVTPTFTTGKMRYMFPILIKYGKLLENFIDEKCVKKEILDIKEILGCFTTDIIGACAFGLECNTFKNPNSPFRTYGKKIFESVIAKAIMVINFPGLSKCLRIRITPNDVEKFFIGVVKDTVEYREKNNIERKDLLQLLINLKNTNQTLELDSCNDLEFGLRELSALCFGFFVAGFETSSTLMTFSLYELALAQDIQDKLRKEINSVLEKYNGEITYDGIKEMTYLHQVLEESLRKYPPFPILNRSCSREYRIPDTNCTIEENMKVFVSVYGIQHDPDYYPEPERFDPERFNEENKQKRHPYAFLPFGEGPRNCIGLRFGLMQAKIGLISILRNHKILLNLKTKQPIKFLLSFVITVDGGVWLNLEKADIK